MHRNGLVTARLLALFRLSFGVRAPVGRVTYSKAALALVLVKVLGDLWLGRAWPDVTLWRLDAVSPAVQVVPFSYFFGAMWSYLERSLIPIAWSLPFLWVGVSMTARRAWDAGLSPFFSVLLLVPGLQLLLLLALCLAPSRRPEVMARADEETWERRLTLGVALITVGGLVGGLAILFSLDFELSPAWITLFTAAPFLVGFATAMAWNWRFFESASSTQMIVQIAVFSGSIGTVLLGFEGLIFLLVVLPVTAAIAALGGVLGRALAVGGRFGVPGSILLLFLAPLVPMFGGVEDRSARVVKTTHRLVAPAEQAWPHLVRSLESPPSRDPLVDSGLAVPEWADGGEPSSSERPAGSAPGGADGAITHWQEPVLVALDGPGSRSEGAAFSADRPRALRDRLVFERGEIRLVPLPSGRARIERSTWYRHDLAPRLYWDLWADALVHWTNRRFLRRVAAQTQKEILHGRGLHSAEPH